MKRPLIGITSGLNDAESFQVISRHFMNALVHSGAMPVLIPLTSDESVLKDYVSIMDGFLFSGGGDVDPLLFGQLPRIGCGEITPDRDEHELKLMKILLEDRSKPVLGVCRGFQVMNIALGGDIYQDLGTDYEGDLIAHSQKKASRYPSHPISLKADSILHHISKKDSILVNSLHHQAVRNMGKDFVPTSFAPDGVIEAAELKGHPFFVGVQWHPERLWENDMTARALFCAFTDACRMEKP